MDVVAKRLKEARTLAGLSQERLGVLAGIDEMSASARMNQYERGKHVPDFGTVVRIAAALSVPPAYFYSTKDDEADLLVKFHRMTKAQRVKVIDFVDGLAP
ncbi:helix-turn-helix transcriptional regulator [Ralstonia sp. GX3-BWBA]|uniref:helix-turn-helix domain-containing protein n=1 Tax=Ralstonia sp. GX3-BWBA TaxID=2219865 RepID=UPI000DD3493F|nr:helix-turn-helix transcriptional regulator [Ralstonia sp. GX3-BWBA]